MDNPLLLRTLKRKLARLNTIVHEYDLGIRQAQVSSTGDQQAAEQPSPVQAEENE